MQSIRQYRQLRERVKSDIVDGRIARCTAQVTQPVLESQGNVTDSSTFTGSQTVESEKGYALLVAWEGPHDPLDPRNWPLTYRCWIFVILWINVFAVDWASSADSQAGSIIAEKFGVSQEAEALSPSLYTFGIAGGAVFAGPISETIGRNPVYVLSRCLHVAWLLGAALAPNFGAHCIFRLFAGFSGSILLAIHSASIADIFGPVQRTIAWPAIALASFWGTAFSPIAGGWIAQSGIDWRWTEWVALILSGSTLFLTLFFLPETFSPILLKWKAEHLRQVTEDDRYLAELDLQSTIWHRFKVSWRRALHMITREPIVVCLGLWLVLEYVVIFGFLQGFTFIFGDTYGFSRGLIGTSFVTIALGTLLWTLSVPLYHHYYKRKALSMCSADDNGSYLNSNSPGINLPDPEYRLWQALLAAPAFPISLFWLGWTNYPNISPFSSLGAIVLLGFSWAGIYVTVYQYILDVYGIYAGSALSIITCWRYLVSGAFNLIARPMYNGIGVHWTMTWLGCLATVLMAAPVVFYNYGPRIRVRSAFAARYSRPGNPRKRIGVAAGSA